MRCALLKAEFCDRAAVDIQLMPDRAGFWLRCKQQRRSRSLRTEDKFQQWAYGLPGLRKEVDDLRN